MGSIDKVKNAMQSAKGRAKKEAGRTSRNRSLEAQGQADQSAGSLKQAGENVNDAFDK